MGGAESLAAGLPMPMPPASALCVHPNYTALPGEYVKWYSSLGVFLGWSLLRGASISRRGCWRTFARKRIFFFTFILGCIT
jgi:hypothetical protein